MNFATLQTGGFTDEDLVHDGWTDISQRIRDRVVAMLSEPGAMLGPELMTRAYEDSDDEKMQEIRARVDAIVADPAPPRRSSRGTASSASGRASTTTTSRRSTQPGCRLVDTDGQGVERIDATGVWANGVHYELDCLIFASGFEVGTDYARRSGYETIGRGGVSLSDKWADGAQTLHGYHVQGFPNLFIIGISQAANLISNITHNLTEAGTTIAQVVAHTLDIGATEVEATAEAERAWVAGVESNVGNSFLFNPECTPGYYNNEGHAVGRRERLNSGGFPGGPVGFFEHIDAWRRSESYAGLEFR